MHDDSRIRLRWSQVALYATTTVYTLILFSWVALTVVNAQFPTQFWLAAEIPFIFLLSASIGIAGRSTSDLDRTLSFIPICFVASVGIGAKNAVHLVLIALELAGGTSGLATTYYWYLFVFDMFLGLLFALDVLMVYHLYRFKENLEFRKLKKYK